MRLKLSTLKPAKDRAHRLATQKRYRETEVARYKDGVRKAKKKRVQWDLTLAEYRWLMEESVCHYCTGALPKSGFGLDRLDPAIGYVIENVVPCCATCNMLKGRHLNEEEARILARVLLFLRARVPESEPRAG